MEKLKSVGNALKSAFSKKSGKSARKNLILSVVALVEVILITITASYAWIESISSVVLKTNDPGTIDTFTYNDAIFTDDSSDAIDMGLFFREAGNAHLSNASSADGKSFVFPVSASLNSTASWREANVNDKNVNYIDYTFNVSTTNELKLYFDSVPIIKADGEVISDNSIRFAITANDSTTVFSNSASTESVVSDVSGTTKSESVQAFADYVKNADNAKPVLKFNGGTGTKLVNVRMWLQNSDTASNYAGKTITVENFKLVPVSTKIVFQDLTTGHGENVSSYLGNNSALIYFVANNESYQMTQSSDNSTLWVVNVSSEALTGDYEFQRINPKTGSVWNKWTTSETARSSAGSNTFTAIGSFDSSSTGFGTWQTVSKIALDTEDTDVITKASSNYVNMSVDGFSSIEMTFDAEKQNWFGYVPSSTSTVRFLNGTNTFTAENRTITELESTYVLTSLTTGYWDPCATINIVTDPASLQTDGAYSQYVSGGDKKSVLHVSSGSKVTLTAVDMDDNDVTTGYLFLGWYDSNDNRLSTSKSYIVTAGDADTEVTYTAKFVKGYTVTVKAQDMTTGTANYESGLVNLTMQYTDQLGNEISYSNSSSISANIPENTSLLISYKFVDSDVSRFYTTSLYDAETGGSPVAVTDNQSTTYIVTSDAVLYQRFEPITITLSAQQTDGTGLLSDDGNILLITDTSNAEITSIKYGNVATFTATSADKYNFVGWYNDLACTTPVSDSTVSSVTYTYTDSPYKLTVDKNANIDTNDNLNLYAKFELKTYTITATANTDGTVQSSTGGTVQIGTSGTGSAQALTTVTHGDSVTLVATPASGYSFIGWYKNSDCSGTAVSTSATNVLNNVTATTNYYALFKKDISVTVNAVYNGSVSSTGGTVQAGSATAGETSTATAHDGDTVTITATPASGYSFDGWYTDLACTTTIGDTYQTASQSITVGSNDITYYAKFTTLQQTVIYFSSKIGYDNYYAYLYQSSTQIAGSWPGTKVTTTETIDGITYYKYVYTGSATGSFRVIVNNGNGTQYPASTGLEGQFGNTYYFNSGSPTELSDTPESTTKTIYFVPSSNWTQSNPRFAIYAFNSSSDYTWYDMTATSDSNEYSATVSLNYANIIFVRMNGSTTANNWDNKWNQTADLTLPTDSNNKFTLESSGWNNLSGTWTTK